MSENNNEDVSQLNYKDQSYAPIIYSVDKDDDIVKINIELEDYDRVSVEKLCMILDVLYQDSGYIETITMIKNGLQQEGQEEALIQVLTHIGQQCGKKIIKQIYEQAKNKPCIRPSDMLQ